VKSNERSYIVDKRCPAGICVFALWIFVLGSILLYGTQRLPAQVDTGSIAGTVTDPSGAAVPHADVSAVEAGSGTRYTTLSSSSGYYTFASVRPGSYTIIAKAPGFAAAKVTGVTVSISTRAPQNLSLPLASAAESVQVNADALHVETESSDIGTVISSREVEDLPLIAGGIRSFSQLAFLSPGAVGPGTNGGTTYTKIGGGQTEGSDFLIDGISTFRSENGTAQFDQTTPSVDAIQEFKVETLSLPAYLGRSTGGIANFKTRSGTNEYHGMVYDFFKNTALDANNWFNNGNAVANPAMASLYARPKDDKNDFGITLGGPLVIPHVYNGHDRTFFFFDWEQYRFGSSGVSVQTVPTLAQRSGDFSSTLGGPVASMNNVDPCTGLPVLNGQIFDPNTTQFVNGVYCRTPFPNNQVPVNRSSVAQKVLALIPKPNFTGVGTQNFSQGFTDETDQTVYSLRLDQNFGTRQHLFFFGSARENTDGGTLTLPNPLNSGNNVTDQYYKYLRVGYDLTLTPHMVNSLTVGGNRVNSFNIASAASSGTNFDAQLGIPNTANPGVTFPVFNIGEGLPQLGSANYDDNVDNAYIVNDDINYQRGRHSIRFGGTVRYQQFSYINNGPAAGNFGFGRAQTAGTNDPVVSSASGNGIASFLLGVPASAGRSVQLHFPQWRSNYYAAYAQDDWQVRHNLTVNAGLRWSLDTPRHEAIGDTSSLNPTLPNPGANGIPGALQFGGVGPGRDGNRTEQWADNYYKDFAPRIGFSWAPDIYKGKVALRGAYGIMYGPIVYSDYGQGLSTGFTVTSGVTTNANGFLPFGPLDNGPNPTPSAPNLDPTQLNGTGIDFVPKQYGRPGEVQNFSLETETQVAPDLILTIGFLGERGTHLKALLDYPNDIQPKYLALGNVLLDPANSPQAAAAGINIPYANFFTTWPGGQTQQALRPFPQYGYINTDSYLQNTGQSTYDALEVKLERRFRNGLTLLSSYTWSKTLTDADSIQPYYSTVLGQGGTQNPYDLKAEKAVSTQDVPNNFVVSYLYDLPFGHGRKYLSHTPKVVDEAIGGWRVGGIQRYLSGQPISFFGAGGIPGFDNGIRYDLVPGINPVQIPNYGHSNPFNYAGPASAGSVFNKSAFMDPNANRGTGPFQFGTMPRNSANIRTPTYFDEDFNISKTFPIHDQVNAEFRVEAFDAFNRHVFSKPDSGVQDTNFGQITGLINGPRNLQLVLKIHY
jgi:hypothetical protein